MKTIKIILPILLLTLIATGVSPALAKGKGSIEYAVTGQIQHMYGGPGAEMFLTLEGRLNLGIPDDESGWSGWMDTQHPHHDEQYDEWWFVGGDPEVPQWILDATFENVEGKQYRADISLSRDFVWNDHFRTFESRWYDPRGSWSGKLVAMWSPISPEKFSVQLSPWKVEKWLTEGDMSLDVDSSNIHEHWTIWAPDGMGGEDWIGDYYRDFKPDPEGYGYNAETLNLYFTGQIKRKGTTLEGWLDIQENSMSNGGEHVGVHGHGVFGPYWIGFPHGGGGG